MRAFLLAIGVLQLATSAVAQGGVADDPRFVRGRAMFDRAFHRRAGLGLPDFNADSCRACHQDPSMGGSGSLELNVSRFGLDYLGAGPFTDLPGGQGLSKLRPPYAVGREEYVAQQPDVFEQRQTPSLFGLGRIAAIPAIAITANEDPIDADGDGIRGIARRVSPSGTIEIGRFGWKAQIATIRDFMHDALANEVGLTTPDEGRNQGLRTDADEAADPEIQLDQIDDLEFFVANLPAPLRRGSTDPRVAEGETLFTTVGCAKCHIPSMPSADGPVRLYSNLLLHNVMPAGFRGMAEPGAGVGFYRTPPLWGIGDTAPYMHDGRAETLEAAIGAHDGEAAGVRAAYIALTAEQQAALILFLKDL